MKTFYLLVISSFLLASCGLHRTSYIAPMPNTPMFTKKEEVYFNGAISPTHVDFQGGISLTNHVGIIASRFYSGSIRNSNELGVNFFTPIRKNFYVSSTLGWGKTQIGNYHSNPFNSNEQTELHVNYNTMFIQPSLYFVEPVKYGTIRYGFSLKYGINQLNRYYYNEYKTFSDNSIKEQTVYTAPTQVFSSLSPIFSIEYTTNNISFGSHIGCTTTSSITAYSQYTNSSTPIIKPQVRSQRELYYWPVILDFYIGLRL